MTRLNRSPPFASTLIRLCFDGVAAAPQPTQTAQLGRHKPYRDPEPSTSLFIAFLLEHVLRHQDPSKSPTQYYGFIGCSQEITRMSETGSYPPDATPNVNGLTQFAPAITQELSICIVSLGP
jgi:hypothetical protein